MRALFAGRRVQHPRAVHVDADVRRLSSLARPEPNDVARVGLFDPFPPVAVLGDERHHLGEFEMPRAVR